MTGFVIYICIAIALLAAVYRAPVTAVAPVICMFGLDQWAQAMIPFFGRFHTVTNLFAGSLVALGLVLSLFRRRDISMNYSTAGSLVLLLYLYAFTSLIWAPNPDIGLALWFASVPYILTVLVGAPLLVNSVYDVQRMCSGVLLLGASLVLLILIFADWEGRGIIQAGAADGNTGNPLALSQMAGYVALAAMFLPTLKATAFHALLRWLLVAACLILVVKTGSRGQFFGILIGAVFFFLFTLPSRGIRGAVWTVAGLAALLLVAGWAFENFAETGRWSSEGIEEASSMRWAPASQLLAYWNTSTPEAFFFGLGNSAAFHVIGYYPHVAPLEILAEEGLVGFVLFLTIMFLGMHSLIRAYRVVKNDKFARGALLTLGSWFFYELFLSFKQGSLLGIYMLLFFAVVLNQYAKMAFASLRQNYNAELVSWVQSGHIGNSLVQEHG